MLQRNHGINLFKSQKTVESWQNVAQRGVPVLAWNTEAGRSRELAVYGEHDQLERACLSHSPGIASYDANVKPVY